MACENRKESLVALLYGELAEGEELESLKAHVSACADCRREIENLAAARRWLGQAEPAMPPVPRVVVLAPRSTTRTWMSFAAGLVSAAILVAAGFGAARTLVPARSRASIETARSDGNGAWLPRADFEKWIESHRSESQEGAGSLTGSAPMLARERPVSPQDLDAALSRLKRRLDRQQAAEVSYLLQEIAASELRSDTQIDRTQRALQYVALASDPSAATH